MNFVYLKHSSCVKVLSTCDGCIQWSQTNRFVRLYASTNMNRRMTVLGVNFFILNTQKMRMEIQYFVYENVFFHTPFLYDINAHLFVHIFLFIFRNVLLITFNGDTRQS